MHSVGIHMVVCSPVVAPSLSAAYNWICINGCFWIGMGNDNIATAHVKLLSDGS